MSECHLESMIMDTESSIMTYTKYWERYQLFSLQDLGGHWTHSDNSQQHQHGSSKPPCVFMNFPSGRTVVNHPPTAPAHHHLGLYIILLHALGMTNAVYS